MTAYRLQSQFSASQAGLSRLESVSELLVGCGGENSTNCDSSGRNTQNTQQNVQNTQNNGDCMTNNDNSKSQDSLKNNNTSHADFLRAYISTPNTSSHSLSKLHNTHSSSGSIVSSSGVKQVVAKHPHAVVDRYKLPLYLCCMY